MIYHFIEVNLVQICPLTLATLFLSSNNQKVTDNVTHRISRFTGIKKKLVKVEVECVEWTNLDLYLIWPPPPLPQSVIYRRGLAWLARRLNLRIHYLDESAVICSIGKNEEDTAEKYTFTIFENF